MDNLNDSIEINTHREFMNWDKLLSTKRFGMEQYHADKKHARTEFQRDYDRLIFSAPFRRLQNKTQVFPLPGSVFVHNRLTHSLEVSCVGRSLGNNISGMLSDKYNDTSLLIKLQEIGSVVAAACLAHDLGNPPFGHSGEKAISTYFSEGNGQSYRFELTDNEWQDLIHFEGNANAFRLLTHQFNGRRNGGFAMTYSTLASIVKYPYASRHAGNKSKFGFFDSEIDDYRKVADDLGIIAVDDEKTKFVRHPIVYLVEAADDICYQIMDIEDAHKLKILSEKETKELFLNFFDDERRSKIENTMLMVDDVNEQIAYLRSCVIGKLVEECSKTFVEHEVLILKGEFGGPLIRKINTLQKEAYQSCSDMAWKRIYKSSDVLDIELAGNQIVSVLLDKLLHAVKYPDKAYSQLLLNRIPQQYEIRSNNKYARILAVLDYISGMTDVYALDLYRKINGMSLPAL